MEKPPLHMNTQSIANYLLTWFTLFISRDWIHQALAGDRHNKSAIDIGDLATS